MYDYAWSTSEPVTLNGESHKLEMSNGLSVTFLTQPIGKGFKVWICLDKKREY